jgi:nitrogen fixation-related uncharacterized protein
MFSVPAIIATLSPYITRYGRQILIALAIVGVVLCAYLWAYDRGRDAQRDRDAKTIALQDVAVKMGTANVATLSRAISIQNADSRARAASYEAARVSDAVALLAADKRAATLTQDRARLSGIVRTYQGAKGCEAPTALLDAAKDL